MTNQLEHCIYCERNALEVPLLSLIHRGENFWICPQHLPILIHKPAQLAQKLPGAINLEGPAEHHHD